MASGAVKLVTRPMILKKVPISVSPDATESYSSSAVMSRMKSCALWLYLRAFGHHCYDAIGISDARYKACNQLQHGKRRHQS
jgi:hypothetical protein